MQEIQYSTVELTRDLFFMTVNKASSGHQPSRRENKQANKMHQRDPIQATLGRASGTMHAGSANISTCSIIGLGVSSSDELEVLVSRNIGCRTIVLVSVYYKHQNPVGWIKLRTYYRDCMVSVWWISTEYCQKGIVPLFCVTPCVAHQ